MYVRFLRTPFCFSRGWLVYLLYRILWVSSVRFIRLRLRCLRNLLRGVEYEVWDDSTLFAGWIWDWYIEIRSGRLVRSPRLLRLAKDDRPFRVRERPRWLDEASISRFVFLARCFLDGRRGVLRWRGALWLRTWVMAFGILFFVDEGVWWVVSGWVLSFDVDIIELLYILL